LNQKDQSWMAATGQFRFHGSDFPHFVLLALRKVEYDFMYWVDKPKGIFFVDMSSSSKLRSTWEEKSGLDWAREQQFKNALNKFASSHSSIIYQNDPICWRFDMSLEEGRNVFSLVEQDGSTEPEPIEEAPEVLAGMNLGKTDTCANDTQE
ncbi:hypothetical protein PENTCL1PPCAC_12591, partial [Pristionchus entomophagus]